MTAADWDEIGKRHYRKREIYSDLRWTDENGKELNLNDHVVVGCPFGGPIAIVPDERRRSQLQNMEDISFMRIYTCSAKPISFFRWKHRGLIKLGWSEEEHLVVVLEDATIIVYDIHGKQLRYFSMGQECADAHIADAYIWSTGVVVRTAGDYFQFWATMSLLDPDCDPFILSNPNIERPPVFMTAINPDITYRASQRSKKNQITERDFDIEVLISTGDGAIYCVSRMECTKLLQHRGGAIMRMCVSANGRKIAIFDENMNLVVSARDFTRQFSNFSVKAKKQPLAMEWCGSDSVVLVFNNDQIIVAADNEFIPYPYSPNNHIVLIPEVDCLRILTTKTCEVLSIVPYSTQEIFQYGSREPSSLLFDSFEDFDIGDARADSHRRKIKPEQMEDAVTECLKAAKYELEIIEYQIKLLRACKYGKLFIVNQEQFDCDQFVETCRFLRVLNAIRNINVGMPLTFQQFEVLSPQIVVQRLINRKKHLLAIRIAKYLNLPFCVNQALQHWAICKIQSKETQNMSDRKLVALIREKVTACSTDFSYAKIARCAQQRRIGSDLAKLLLDYEPRAKVQIASLIEFEQFIVALIKSLHSMNTNLITQTLIELISKHYDEKMWRKLFEIILENNTRFRTNNEQNPSPFNVILNNVLIETFILLLQSEKDNDAYRRLLEKFVNCANNIYDEPYVQYQAYNQRILCRQNLKKSLLLFKNGNIGLGDDQINDAMDDTKQCLKHLEVATKNNEKLKNKFNVQMCSDMKRMIFFQREFDKKMLISNHSSFDGDEVRTLGLSLTETIAIMLQYGEEKMAEKMKKELFVTEKRWWFILIQVYCEQKQYDKLCHFIDKNSSARRPPPTGYLPIIETFLEIDQKEYAKRYILRLTDIDEKLEWLCQLKLWMDAVDVAADDRDFDALQTIKANCNDQQVRNRINDLLQNLK